MKKLRKVPRVLITHINQGYCNREVHGYAFPAATDEEVQTKAIKEVMGYPFAPFGTREYMRGKDGRFSLVVHTN